VAAAVVEMVELDLVAARAAVVVAAPLIMLVEHRQAADIKVETPLTHTEVEAVEQARLRPTELDQPGVMVELALLVL